LRSFSNLDRCRSI